MKKLIVVIKDANQDIQEMIILSVLKYNNPIYYIIFIYIEKGVKSNNPNNI